MTATMQGAGFLERGSPYLPDPPLARSVPCGGWVAA